jgi:cytoskeletal protein CcmA (bactofilin family)
MAGDSTLVNSIVGPGTSVKGHIDVSGLLRIDGDFSGSIKTTDRVIVGRGGRADCTLDAATVVIGGAFRGTIYASDKVIALESALIIGNIFAPRLIAESGVILEGALHINQRSESETGRPPERPEIHPGVGERARAARRKPRRVATRS